MLLLKPGVIVHTRLHLVYIYIYITNIAALVNILCLNWSLGTYACYRRQLKDWVVRLGDQVDCD